MAVRPIITNINELRRKCEPIEKREDIKEIIRDLQDTLSQKKSYGIAAIQLGIKKQVAIVKIPKNGSKPEFIEYILINPQIVDKSGKIIIDDSCLSFPGLKVKTLRYLNITFYNTNLKGEINTFIVSGLEAIVIQHEIDHCKGVDILLKKYYSSNKKR